MSSSDSAWKPRLSAKARLKFDQVARQEMLLFPEAALILNETAAAIVRLCNGERPVGAIVAEVLREFHSRYPAALEVEVNAFLDRIRMRGLLE